MSVQLTTSKSHYLGGVSFPENLALNADGAIVHDVSVPAAEAGNLTARSSGSVGTITMDDSDHGIVTGRVDIYWAGGCRRGVAAVVSDVEVALSDGAGDDLPSQYTDVTIVNPMSLDIDVTGDDVVGIVLYSGAMGQVVFAATTTEKAAMVVGPLQVWDWNNTNGVVNPLAGDTPDTVFVSHGDVAAQTMRIGILYDNAA